MAEDGNHHHLTTALAGALSISQFCRTYSVGRTFCYGEIAAGRLKARKAANRTLILLADAEGWAGSLPHCQARAVAGRS
jgi:hypothetical protein